MEPVGTDNRNAQYRTLLVIGAILVVGYILWSVRGALMPFAFGAVIAYLLAPLVNRFEVVIPQRRPLAAIRRTLAILAVYLLFGLTLVILGLTVTPILVDQMNELIENLPEYWEGVREEFDYWSERYEREVPPDVQAEIEANLDEISNYLGSIGQRLASATFETFRGLIGFFAGLVLLPLWLFYVLKDQRKGMAYFLRLWPEEVREDVYEIVRIIDRVLASYIRGQLFLGLVVGTVTGLGMWAIGVQQPLALGIVAGIFEMVPILGPWISFVVAAIVVLATDPSKIFLVAILSLGIQQLENTFLVPRIQGSAVNMNPAIIMMLLVIGGAKWGLIGIIVIVPMAAVARDVFIYVYNRLADPEEEDESELSPAGELQAGDEPVTD